MEKVDENTIFSTIFRRWQNKNIKKISESFRLFPYKMNDKLQRMKGCLNFYRNKIQTLELERESEKA